MDFDVVVVGGGPAGSFTALNIAKNGFKVLVVEEHKKIGEPVQCAGLVSPRTMLLAEAPGDLVIREYSAARILSATGSQLLIGGESIHAQAVDRAAFDRHLAGRALNSGAEVVTGARAAGISSIPGGYKVSINRGKEHMTASCRLLICADGVKSRTARWLGLQSVTGRVNMYAGDFELCSQNPGEVTILLGQTFAPGWFGWVIPLTERTARVGVGSMMNEHSPRQCLKKMIEFFPSTFYKCKELKYTGGSVPFGIMQKIYAPNAMLVGDAAAQVKPMSGGGIYTGLKAARICARLACEALSKDRLSEKFLSKYQMIWENEFITEFRSGLRHRDVYSSMSDHEMDRLMRFLDHPYWRKLIARHGDIDYPSWLARRLFSAGPWLQKFARAAVEMIGCRDIQKARVEA